MSSSTKSVRMEELPTGSRDSTSLSVNEDERKQATKPINQSALNSSQWIGQTENQEVVFRMLHRRDKRRGQSIELVLHVLFTAIFITIMALQRSVNGSSIMNAGITSALVTQQISFDLQPFPTTFTDIGSWDQVRDYLMDVLAGTLDTTTYYNGDNYTGDESTKIQYNNKLIGGIRLRQLRVRNNSCEIPPYMRQVAKDVCYANSYDSTTKDTAPFGPDGKYTYTAEKDSRSVSIWGYAGDWYEGGGYIVDIPLGSNFTHEIETLINDRWYDQGTRAIIISLCTLNVHLDARMAVSYLILEMQAGGAITPTQVTKLFRMYLYFSSLDKFRAFFEVVFVLLLIYWIAAEVFEYKKIYTDNETRKAEKKLKIANNNNARNIAAAAAAAAATASEDQSQVVKTSNSSSKNISGGTLSARSSRMKSSKTRSNLTSNTSSGRSTTKFDHEKYRSPPKPTYRYSSLAYFRSMWNLLEVVNLLAFLITLIMYFIFLGSPERGNLNLESLNYIPELEGLASKATLYYNISAFNLLICAFRTFKYFRLNARMASLWNSLRRAGGDIASFLLMFFILLMGFLLFGWISFGADIPAFNSFPNSWGSCWNFVMGNPPDYVLLSKSNRVLGPLFFMLFTIFIFFIMVNMFVAILSDALGAERSKRKKRVTQSLINSTKELFYSITNRIKGKNEVPLKTLIQTMHNPKVLDSPTVDISDLKAALEGPATPQQLAYLKSLHEQLHEDEEQYSKEPHNPKRNMRAISMLKAEEEDSDIDDDDYYRSDDVATLARDVADLHKRFDDITKLLQEVLHQKKPTPSDSGKED